MSRLEYRGFTIRRTRGGMWGFLEGGPWRPWFTAEELAAIDSAADTPRATQLDIMKRAVDRYRNQERP